MCSPVRKKVIRQDIVRTLPFLGGQGVNHLKEDKEKKKKRKGGWKIFFE
jgi:hypothetical protein